MNSSYKSIHTEAILQGHLQSCQRLPPRTVDVVIPNVHNIDWGSRPTSSGGLKKRIVPMAVRDATVGRRVNSAGLRHVKTTKTAASCMKMASKFGLNIQPICKLPMTNSTIAEDGSIESFAPLSLEKSVTSFVSHTEEAPFLSQNIEVNSITTSTANVNITNLLSGDYNFGTLQPPKMNSSNGSCLLSSKDQSALKLGRLILSSVLNQPEVTLSDSISRFFMDTWLARNDSSTATADTLSIALMSNLQKSFTDFDPGVEPSATTAATSQKCVCAIACDALDTLIEVFGKQNPILKDIREAILPCIFMIPPMEPPPHGTGEVQSSTSSTHQNQPKITLDGAKYIKLNTWCEDASLIIQNLRDTEVELEQEKVTRKKTEKELKMMTSKYDKKVISMEQSQGKLVTLERELDRIKGRNRDISSTNETLVGKVAELNSLREQEANLIAELRKINKQLLDTNMHMNERIEIELLKHNTLMRTHAQACGELEKLKLSNTTFKLEIQKQNEDLQAYKSELEFTQKYIQDKREFEAEQLSRFVALIESDPRIGGDLPSNVLHLLRAKEPNISLILEEWSLNLVGAKLKLQEQCSPEDIQKLLDAVRNEVRSEWHEKLAECATRHDREIKKSAEETIALRAEIIEVKRISMESNIEKAVIEDEKNLVSKNFEDIMKKYTQLRQQHNLVSERQMTLKISLQNRIDMLNEDKNFEMLLRQLQSNHKNLQSSMKEANEQLQLKEKEVHNLRYTLEGNNVLSILIHRHLLATDRFDLL